MQIKQLQRASELEGQAESLRVAGEAADTREAALARKAQQHALVAARHASGASAADADAQQAQRQGLLDAAAAALARADGLKLLSGQQNDSAQAALALVTPHTLSQHADYTSTGTRCCDAHSLHGHRALRA
jgi:hypothetical protein